MGWPGTVAAMNPPTAGIENDHVQTVELDALDLTWRLRPLDQHHVDRLVGVLDYCPPILVWRAGLVLLDGHMRVEAALRDGRGFLPVTWFDGDADEALEAAATANAAHGLPLTATERKAALAALMQLAPQWSNRRLARAAGVSEAAVRQMRCPGALSTQVDTVVGADGKRYPLDGGLRSATAIALLQTCPEMSDRAIARSVGLSPTTVGKLRAKATATQPPGPATPATPAAVPPPRNRWLAFWTRVMSWLLRRFTNTE